MADAEPLCCASSSRARAVSSFFLGGVRRLLAGDQQAVLIEEHEAQLVHHVLVVLPERKAQLAREFLDGSPLADQEMPVVTGQVTRQAVLPGGSIIGIRVVTDHYELGPPAMAVI